MKTVEGTFQANLSFCDNFLQCLSLYVCSIAVDRIQNYTQLTVCYCSQYATFFVFLDLMPLSSYLFFEKKFCISCFFCCHVIMHAKLFLACFCHFYMRPTAIGLRIRVRGSLHFSSVT